MLVAWKESGGFAGTQSPNAAFATTVLSLGVGSSYTVWVVWKANRPPAGVIYAGAGPMGTRFSPTWLTAEQLG